MKVEYKKDLQNAQTIQLVLAIETGMASVKKFYYAKYILYCIKAT